MQRILMIFVAVLVLLSLLWPLLKKAGLGRVPGDVEYDTPTGKIYIPVGAAIAITLAITLTIWLTGK